MTKLNLKEMIGNLATALNTTYQELKFFSNNVEYVLPNVIEQNLLDYGFVFTGYNVGHTLPIYNYNNLQAHYDGQLLHVYEIGE